MNAASKMMIPPMKTGAAPDAASVVAALSAHAPLDATEAAHVAATQQFVSSHTHNFWSRENLAGHVTASVFVINDRQSAALLLHHAALDKWLQPGGHVEPSDGSIVHAALRELAEEAGLMAQGVEVATPWLFDVDVHLIPARIKDGTTEPQHHHYDLRILVTVAKAFGEVALSNESHSYEWVSLAALAARETSSGIGRMGRKALMRNRS
jgi:8-oxo-dGTP pyrophosphatase MutT (NUDIX family)